VIKQIMVLLGLTFAAIVFRSQLSHVLNSMILVHNWVASHLHQIFSDDHLGRIIQNMIALLIIPGVVGLMLAVTFLLIRKTAALSHVMIVIWMVWTVLLVTMVAQTGGSQRYLMKRTHVEKSTA
jgi:hypothetical protein